MRELIAAANVVVPGREPHVDAVHHRVRLTHAISHRDRPHQHDRARERQSGASARHAEHRQEDEERHQRRAQILEDKKEDQRHGDRAGDGEHVFEARHASTPEETGQNPLFAQVPEAFPMAGEIAGQKEHQQNLDRFHGLERPEVDLGVVAGRPFAERQQQSEERQRTE